MHDRLGQSTAMHPSLLKLGPNHGYRFDGDTAILNAELAVDVGRDRSLDQEQQWALQLWACEQPHQGGPLSGIKIVEAPLTLPTGSEPERLEAAALAQLPPGRNAYDMVLVLASGREGHFDRVHDYANYPARQEFTAPHLDGGVGYRLEDEQTVFQVERVRNPRAGDNLSGSLSLELWALRTPFQHDPLDGVQLGAAALGCLSGQSELHAIEQTVPVTQLPVGTWHITLLLREWTLAGYVTRDFCSFERPHHVPRILRAVPIERPTKAVPSLPEHEPAPPDTRLEEPVQAAAEEVLDEASVSERIVAADAAAPVEEIATRAEDPNVAPAAPVVTAAMTAPQRLSVTTAAVEDLELVPGLNKKLAQAIVRGRPYSKFDDLLRVRGIGVKVLQKLRSVLTV